MRACERVQFGVTIGTQRKNDFTSIANPHLGLFHQSFHRRLDWTNLHDGQRVAQHAKLYHRRLATHYKTTVVFLGKKGPQNHGFLCRYPQDWSIVSGKAHSSSFPDIAGDSQLNWIMQWLSNWFIFRINLRTWTQDTGIAGRRWFHWRQPAYTQHEKTTNNNLIWLQPSTLQLNKKKLQMSKL